ncbi:MAG TPA: energy transducer TonB [Burkholderiaceae bacterium]|nr:energy transducer TonB [Burkholderiaceae bacterium]
MSPLVPSPVRPRLKGLTRQTTLVLGVVGLHVAALVALQSGLLRRAVDMVVPVEVLAQVLEPAQPQAEPPPQPKPKVTPQPVVPKPTRQALTPPPLPLAVQTDTPSPNAVAGTTTPQPPAPPVSTPVATAPSAPPAPPALPAPPRIQLPDSNADYLNNRPPAYPPLSRRLGEQGKVLVRVLIEVDGSASQAEVKTSSGYDRLDQAALKTVLGWKYVPGKVNGEPKAMWFNVPLHFVLE